MQASQRTCALPPSFALAQELTSARHSYDDFYEPLRDLLRSCAPASPARPSAEQLLEAFNDPETSNGIVVFLRLLTSAYMRANEDDFVPFLFSLEDDPRFFEGGVPTLDQFCGFHVEVRSFLGVAMNSADRVWQAVNKEADRRDFLSRPATKLDPRRTQTSKSPLSAARWGSTLASPTSTKAGSARRARSTFTSSSRRARRSWRARCCIVSCVCSLFVPRS